MKILGLRDIESLAQGQVEESGFEPKSVCLRSALPGYSSTTSSLSPVCYTEIQGGEEALGGG